jgi:predicted metallo-beta-lactamase superfamily hydrolase
MNFNDLINNKKFILNPICAESRGIRSFCTLLKTPDLSILLDPGCALGLREKYKYPHPFEFVKLYFYTKKILELAKDSRYIFISHYHHDHFKPNIEDNFLIYSNREIFNELYQNKIIFAKNFKKNINLNQRERGEAFKRDIEK